MHCEDIRPATVFLTDSQEIKLLPFNLIFNDMNCMQKVYSSTD